MTIRKRKEFLVDTDILIDHLKKSPVQGQSYLVKLMKKGMCFTTVLNAAEIFIKCNNQEEEFYAKSMLSALKVLGIPARYCLFLNQYSIKSVNVRDALFMVTAKINKIDIITLNIEKYQLTNFPVIHPDIIS